MKDSLKKYLTKTYLYHLVTGTEDDFFFDQVIYSIVTPFNFFKTGFKRGLCNKTQPHTRLIDEIPYTIFFITW